MRPLTLALLLACTLTLGLSPAAHAHELEADRLTLVLRQPQHLSLRFQLNLVALLHRSLAPQQPAAEFALQMASLEPAAFAAQWQRAQARVQQGTRLAGADGRWHPASQWQWPTAAQVQAQVQQQLMQAVVAPDEHAHGEALEVQAEWLAPSPLEPLSLQLPPELPRLLVVHYQPQQRWVRPEEGPARFRF
ncbi:hypothetical protein [Inhella proteolytica]|uniref:DUF2796 domain-containing protein n=1 Tax=Inhella proteolytica TaxID=2795029 RepID=A0A931IXS0_9BURK|nr:hypothetical protein [Inhella proteolytica]MBH9575676.1 hypothetical protein [Inhella proteolytica]